MPLQRPHHAGTLPGPPTSRKSCMSAKTISHYLDSLGTLASTACAVHCLLTPLVLGMLPLLGIGFLAADWFENAAVIGAIALGVISMIHGYLHHRRFRVVGLLMGGIILLLAGPSLHQPFAWGHPLPRPPWRCAAPLRLASNHFCAVYSRLCFHERGTLGHGPDYSVELRINQ